jgi:hypothetical protein
VLTLCGAFMSGSPGDEEELRYAILSAWLHARAPWSLDAEFWTPLLGLGLPQPMVPSFSHHPLSLLLAWMPPVGWVQLVLIAHTAVGAAGMWRLGAAFAMPPLVRATGVVTFLLAAPLQNYVLIDFWVTTHLAWALLPWIALAAWKVIDPATTDRDVRRWAAALGLVSGVTAASGHPGYFPVFVPVAATILIGGGRTTVRRAGWIAAAGLIAAAIAAPVLVQITTEVPHFDPALEWLRNLEPLPFAAAWTALAHPFVLEPAMRTLYFGAPYTLLALAGCALFVRARVDLVLGLLLSAVWLFTAWTPVALVSQRYQFRDPVIFCGILLAGLVLTRMMASRTGRPIAVAAVVLQLAAMATGVTPALTRYLDEGRRGALVARGAVADTTLVDTLIERMPSRGRVLYSPRLSSAVARRELVIHGLGVNALAYRGIPLVNGSFKGVSTGVIAPDDRLFYGAIHTSDGVYASAAALDLLAIRYVLAYRDDVPPPGLAAVAQVTTALGTDLVLFENADAWPGAFLLEPSFSGEELPVVPGCDHDRLTCRDFSPLLAHRDPASIEVTRAADHIRIALGQTSETPILVVSEMFRPGWVATAGDQTLPTRAMFGGLIGVPLPAGTRAVTLAYRPRPQRIAWFVSLGGIAAAIGLAGSRRGRSTAAPTSPSRPARLPDR